MNFIIESGSTRINLMSDINNAESAKFPKEFSYRPVIEAMMQNLERPAKSASAASSFKSTTSTVICPNLKLGPGDHKTLHKLSDGGKLIHIFRPANNETIYALKCADGRRVYLVRNNDNETLTISNERGQVTKAIGFEKDK
ncbi:hypothetical protein WR25_07698 [Diploscapter pachys]|uniref:Uncharacterized protein n=1 Tax=Diploscapter pachys TaxID=2018661 RepID=A0A2A2JPB9_9BILA|nr:hypothetical protein WR25_07698 [Diploscapter pachys]